MEYLKTGVDTRGFSAKIESVEVTNHLNSELTMNRSIGFVKDAECTPEDFLQQVYASVGAASTSEKLTLLTNYLGGEPNFYAMGGAMTEEMKLGCLEYEYLENQGVLAAGA
ncbi:MAG: hypothetical protein H7A46_03795 [Verrucomicrobiales bacterium]|nr:hypothetical protein [Verrucomicrobiales bacterium]